MTDLKKAICKFKPLCEQEESDRGIMMRCLDTFDDLLTRDNPIAHFTASAWITDRERSHVLMIYHNLYDSWAWTGGHADGDADLLHVAVKEACEETGLEHVIPVYKAPISLEILPVNPHIKRGKYVSSHLHLNLTYLLEADTDDALRICPDENSGVRWFTPEEAIAASSEPEMHSIYKKLNARMR